MGYFRAENPVLHFEDINGRPLVGGKLFTYEAGTSTPVATYRDAAGQFVNENPILLNERGECVCFMEDNAAYKLVLKDKFDTVIWEADDIRTQPGGVVFTGNVFPMKIFTEGDHVPDAEYDPLDEDKDNLTQRSLKIKINGTLKTTYKPFTTGDKEIDILSENVSWDSASHSIKKSYDETEETVVEVQSAINRSDLRPVNGKAVADEKYVSVKSQSWTFSEKQQARYNIAAIKGGDYLPRGSAVYASLTEISWHGGFGGILSLISGSHTESAHLPPVADVTDRGKALFAKQYDGDVSELVYRFILENCNTNAKVLEALQNGQVPCFKNNSGTFVPFLADVTGVMHLYNVFGVTTQEPFAGDALGRAINTKVVNGNVVQDCLWGKPYGINLFEYELVKWNDCTFGNSSYQVSDSVEMWRQIPFDRSITIKGMTLFSYRDSAYKSFIKGIYRVDGDNASVVSSADNWGISTSRYLHQPKEVLSKGVIIEGSTPEATPIYVFDFVFSPITLEAGNNYLFPCMTAGNNSYSGKGAVMVCYKDASPAMPWETIWTSDENGNPIRGTSTFKEFSYCCRPSLLKITLSDNTQMWI